MDLIEQLFGIAPDIGSGVLEYCLIAVLFGVLVLGTVVKARESKSRRRDFTLIRVPQE